MKTPVTTQMRQERISRMRKSKPTTETALVPDPKRQLTGDQVDLIKRTIAKGASDDELSLFLGQSRRLGLDPFSRQIHLVPIWDSQQQREVRVTVVGIDGLRVIADRTGRYRPDEEAPRFTYDESGQIRSAKVRTWRFHPPTEQWHPVEEEARYTEFVRRLRDGTPMANWRTMPHVMLAKAAESRALRKAFPLDLSGIYVEEELGALPSAPQPLPTSEAQSETLGAGLAESASANTDQRQAIHRLWHAKLGNRFPDHDAAERGLDAWLRFMHGTESTEGLSYQAATGVITALQRADAPALDQVMAVVSDLMKETS